MEEKPPDDAGDGSDRSDGSDGSSLPHRLRPSGGYRTLRSFRSSHTLICLIHQANYLLDQQISALEQDFIKQGGYSERLAAARIAERARASQTKGPQPTAPCCPLCGKPMALRTARKGPHAGSQFWGCSGYPGCKGTRPV